jgi:hypothetical protein
VSPAPSRRTQESHPIPSHRNCDVILLSPSLHATHTHGICSHRFASPGPSLLFCCCSNAPTNTHLPPYIKLPVANDSASSYSHSITHTHGEIKLIHCDLDQTNQKKKKSCETLLTDEVRQAPQEADRGEPAGVAEPVPQLQGAEAARECRVLPRVGGGSVVVQRRGGRLPDAPGRRDRQVQRLLPGAGGGVRDPAEGAPGAHRACGRARGHAGARPARGGGLARRDGAAAQLQQRQLHGPRQDPQEVRQAHRRRAPPPRHRAGAAAALLHHRPHLRAGQGLRGRDGGRLPARRQQGPPRAPGAGRRRAGHLPQHRRRAAHHAGGAQRELHRRPFLAAAHAAAAGVGLARPVR